MIALHLLLRLLWIVYNLDSICYDVWKIDWRNAISLTKQSNLYISYSPWALSKQIRTKEQKIKNYNVSILIENVKRQQLALFNVHIED